MVWKVRRETVVSQHIEVALVYREMLGLDEAARYLEHEGIDQEIVDRILFTDRKRGPPVAPLSHLQQQGCRRRNRVHDAIVEAALKIEKKLGKEMALALLKDEQVPQAVVDRVTAPEPRQLRVRKLPA